MPVENDADRAIFVSSSDFGASVSWTSAGGTVAFAGIFDAEYLLIGNEAVDGGAEGSTPMLTCRDADVPADAAQGDTVAITGAAAGDGSYTVVELIPDGTGMTAVRLQEA